MGWAPWKVLSRAADHISLQQPVGETRGGGLGGGAEERTCGWVALKETLERVYNVERGGA